MILSFGQIENIMFHDMNNELTGVRIILAHLKPSFAPKVLPVLDFSLVTCLYKLRKWELKLIDPEVLDLLPDIIMYKQQSMPINPR